MRKIERILREKKSVREDFIQYYKIMASDSENPKIKKNPIREAILPSHCRMKLSFCLWISNYY